ncbi:MAG: peptidoglycan DD-metalloendopeptidase family protein [Pseudomonadales bacterium]|nr:peptidoglycan DD-metalloendopeptidase family protein [Pseudomonadales bacterium]MCP5357101.1 peptidoglycan DD-metalloendopeptidase family protein [Pseudomonadales bacterium]
MTTPADTGFLARRTSWLPGLIVFLLAGNLALAQDAPPEEQLAAVDAAIAKIETWLNDADNNRSSLESELRANTRRLDTLNGELTDNRQAISRLNTELNNLKVQSQTLEQDRETQRTLIAQAVRASYLSGREPYLKLMLNQEDPGASARMMQYYQAYNRARLARIEQFRDTLAALTQTRQKTEEAAAQLSDRQTSLDDQLRTLASEQAERETLLLALNEDIASRSGELAQLAQDREHLEALIQQIQDAIAAIPAPEQLTPFSQAQGSLPWPVDGAPLNRFGASYSDGNLHRQGIVLRAEAGSPVRAIHPGRVVFSDWLRGSGLLVVVDHGEGYLSLYANNRSLVKRKGDWVNRGEALATAGDDAGMDQPGIYFEIRHNGQAQDPAQWCRS